MCARPHNRWNLHRPFGRGLSTATNPRALYKRRYRTFLLAHGLHRFFIFSDAALAFLNRVLEHALLPRLKKLSATKVSIPNLDGRRKVQRWIVVVPPKRHAGDSKFGADFWIGYMLIRFCPRRRS